MRLDWAIPCMSVTMEGPIVRAIENACFDTIWVESLPQAVELIALVRILGQRDEFIEDAPRNMEAQLTGPGMEGLLSIEFELPTGEPDPDHPEGWEVGGIIPILVQVTLRAEGTHMLDFYVNGRYQQGRSIPLRVRVGQPPSEAPTV
jgi:hypothetical protein